MIDSTSIASDCLLPAVALVAEYLPDELQRIVAASFGVSEAQAGMLT